MQWLTWPNLVTASRLFLFVIFIFVVDSGWLVPALLLFVVAWGLDAVDGWLARTLGQETEVGYLFDKITDRLILVGSLLVLVIYQFAPVWSFIILTKDILAGGAIVSQRPGRMLPDLGLIGKWLAVWQGISIIWLLLEWPGFGALAVALGLLGVLVGLRYSRELMP